MKPKVTASQRCGVESNRRRMGSPQSLPSRRRGMTNPFRRRDAASLPELGEAWVSRERPISIRWCDCQSDIEAHEVVGDGMSGRQGKGSEETCRLCARPLGSPPCGRAAGVRARVAAERAFGTTYRSDPVQRDREKAGQHKPVRGKVGRKVEA